MYKGFTSEEVDRAKAFYKEVRKTRTYLPKWRDLSDRHRELVLRTTTHIETMKNSIAGGIYHALRKA